VKGSEAEINQIAAAIAIKIRCNDLSVPTKLDGRTQSEFPGAIAEQNGERTTSKKNQVDL